MTTTKAGHLRKGEKIRSPFGGHTLTVVNVKPGMYDLVDITATDDDGDRHTLALDYDETVEVKA